MSGFADITAYPLRWPPGVERTEREWRERARFSKHGRDRRGNKTRGDVTVAEGIRRVMAEIRLYTRVGHDWVINPDEVVISTNLRVRVRDGHPMSGQREPEDPGVAVYFAVHGESRCIPCDRWDRVADNLAAVAAALGALRGLDRWVNDAACRAVFEGFALPSPHQVSGVDWRTVLGLHGEPAVTEEVVQDAYRVAIRVAHPDRGGSTEKAAQVNEARRQALAAIGADS